MAEQKLSNAKRNQIEQLVYSTFDTIDPSHTNSDYYKELFSGMDNDQFYKFLQRRLPFRTHITAFKIEPKMPDIFKAFKGLNKPLLEKVHLPYLYQDENGRSIETKEALVIYINIKRMKQFLSKKNSTAIETAQRDMKTGLLLNEDKGGKMTDREFEALIAHDLNYTMDEFSTIRADAMQAKSEAYNTIMNKGYVSVDDIELVKSNIHSNLVDEDYFTPLTLRNRQAKNVERK